MSEIAEAFVSLSILAAFHIGAFMFVSLLTDDDNPPAQYDLPEVKPNWPQNQ